MNSHAANDRVVETLIAASILGRQESAAEFTAEQIAHYFTQAQQPNSQVDEILSHTPASVAELLSRTQTTSMEHSTLETERIEFCAMNRKNSSSNHSEDTEAGLEQARREALERLKKRLNKPSPENHVE
jgi:hypothetical protein